jgi:hypothetical protein
VPIEVNIPILLRYNELHVFGVELATILMSSIEDGFQASITSTAAPDNRPSLKS